MEKSIATCSGFIVIVRSSQHLIGSGFKPNKCFRALLALEPVDQKHIEFPLCMLSITSFYSTVSSSGSLPSRLQPSMYLTNTQLTLQTNWLQSL